MVFWVRQLEWQEGFYYFLILEPNSDIFFPLYFTEIQFHKLCYVLHLSYYLHLEGLRETWGSMFQRKCDSSYFLARKLTFLY